MASDHLKDRTKYEMDRGALNVRRETLVTFVDSFCSLIRPKLSHGWVVSSGASYTSYGDTGTAVIHMRKYHNPNKAACDSVTFEESADVFPSDALRAKIALLAFE